MKRKRKINKKIPLKMNRSNILDMTNKYIYGAFARLRASVCRLMQTFGPFKLSLSNTSESRVK